jgi:hypothetical protein
MESLTKKFELRLALGVGSDLDVRRKGVRVSE